MAESAYRPRSSFSLYTLPQYGQAEIRFCYRSCGGTFSTFSTKVTPLPSSVKNANAVVYQRLVSSTCYSPSQLCVLHLPVEPFTPRDGARYWLRTAAHY